MLTTASLIPLAAGLSTITEILIKVYITIVIAGVVFNIWSWFKSREIKAPFLFLAIFIIGGIIVALAVVFDPNGPLYQKGTKVFTGTVTDVTG